MGCGNDKQTVCLPLRTTSFVAPPSMVKRRLCCSIVTLIFLSLVLPITAQVSISPEELVVAEGRDTAFTCISPSSADTHEWLINGTSLNDGHRKDGVTQERDIQLRFRNASTEYNNTRIQCRAGSEVSSASSLLLVQGPPGAVRSLVAIDGVDKVTVRWTAPFTLDIPRVEPDISGYCVDVVSSTSSATLHSECGINETEFIYPLPPRSWCDVYNITVIPVNVVGNGTTKSILYSRELEGPELIEVISTSINFTLRMSAPVCSATLIFEDTVSGNVTTLENSDLTISESAIVFSLQLLVPNKKYEVTISAMNTRNITASNTQISTHDIENCSLVEGAENVTVFVTFAAYSDATGAMLNFVHINNDGVTIDLTKSLCLTKEKSDVSHGVTLPLDMWYSGQYMLYVYDIESNRKIMNGIQYQASDCNFVAESGQGTTPSPSQSCNVSSTSRMISVECSSLERFQVTAQGNSMENANILHVSSNVDPQTPATLQVTENGEYLVTVLPVQDGRGILDGAAFSQVHMVDDVPTTMQGSTPTTSVSTKPGNSVLGIAISVVVVVMVFLAVVAIIVVVVFKFKKPKIAAASLNDNVTQLPTTSAYDEESAYATVPEVLPQFSNASSINNTTEELQNTSQHAAVDLHTTSERENETSSIERTPFVHHPDASEESPLPEESPTDSSVVKDTLHPTLERDEGQSEPQNTNQLSSSDVSERPLPEEGPAESLVGDGPIPPHPTLESDEGQSKFLGSQYAAVAFNNPATKPAASIEDSQYATPGGYKNVHGQNYTFVDLKKNSVVIPDNIHDGIVYSKILHQGPKSNSQEENKGIQGDRASTLKRRTEATLLEHGVVQTFGAAAEGELPSTCTRNQLRHRHVNVE